MLLWLIFVVGFVMYFFPAMLGGKKRDAVAILALNFFLGWTFIGWVVALVWALTEDSS